MLILPLRVEIAGGSNEPRDCSRSRCPGQGCSVANHQKHCYILSVKKVKAIEVLLERIQKSKLCLRSKH